MRYNMTLKNFWNSWTKSEKKRNVVFSESLKRIGIHDVSDFERVHDRILTNLQHVTTDRVTAEDNALAASYTKRDHGIKKSAVIDQSWDGQTNEDDINKAILKVEIRPESRKDTLVRNVMNACVGRGIFGYMWLRKRLGIPFEHPVMSPYCDSWLPKILPLINPGGKVSLLEGTYSLTGAININSNLSFVGNGISNTTIQQTTAGANTVEMVTKSNVYIADMNIDANSCGSATADDGAIHGTDCDHVTFERIRHQKAKYHGISMVDCENTILHDSVIDNCGIAGGGADGDGISWVTTKAESLEYTLYSIITGNYFHNFKTAQYSECVNLQERHYQLIVANNHLYDASAGIFVSSHTGSSPPQRVIVNGNVLNKIYHGNASRTNTRGIMVGAASDTIPAEHVVISDNIIYDLNTDNQTYLTQGIGMYQLKNALIANNIIDLTAVTQSAGNDGIGNHDVMWSENTNIVGNTIIGAHLAGVQLDGTGGNEYITISDNTIRSCVRGIHVQDGDYIDIHNNDLRGNSTAAITIDGGKNTHGVIYNNRGYNPVGVSTISVGASPYTYTAGASPESVYIRAGTVSLIVKSATTLFVDTGHVVELEPYESVVVTYSGAPTMIKDIH